MRVVNVGNVDQSPPAVTRLISNSTLNLYRASKELDTFLDLLPADGQHVVAAREFAAKIKKYFEKVDPETRKLEDEALAIMAALDHTYCVDRDWSGD